MLFKNLEDLYIKFENFENNQNTIKENNKDLNSDNKDKEKLTANSVNIEKEKR